MVSSEYSNLGQSASFNKRLRAWFIDNGFSRTSRNRARNHIESGRGINQLAVSSRATDKAEAELPLLEKHRVSICLLYTSDAADE